VLRTGGFAVWAAHAAKLSPGGNITVGGVRLRRQRTEARADGGVPGAGSWILYDDEITIDCGKGQVPLDSTLPLVEMPGGMDIWAQVLPDGSFVVTAERSWCSEGDCGAQTDAERFTKASCDDPP